MNNAAVEPPFTVGSPRIAGDFAAFQRTRPAGAIGIGVVVNRETGRRRLERGNLLERFAVAADGRLLTSRHAADGSHELTLRAPGRVGAPLILGPLDAGDLAGPPENGASTPPIRDALELADLLIRDAGYEPILIDGLDHARARGRQ